MRTRIMKEDSDRETMRKGRLMALLMQKNINFYK